MKHELSPKLSLSELAAEEVRSWVADYIRMGRLSFTVDELIAEALRVEGTRRGVTKTKVRKARRSLLQKRGR